MSDPDLYHSDPIRRYAAQQREEARMRKASLPRSQSNNSTNSYNFNDNGSGGGAGLDGMGLLIGGLFLGVATLAYGAVRIPYGVFKFYLNKKAGLPPTDDRNNKKAKILTAAFLGAMAIPIVNHTHGNGRLPAIAIAYHGRTGNIGVGIDSKIDKAQFQAMYACAKAPYPPWSCKIQKSYQRGKKLCVSFGVYKDGTPYNYAPFIEKRITKPKAGSNPASEACISRAKLFGVSTTPCTVGFRTVCNFN